METLSSLLLVSLSIGVTAPVSARPRVPVAPWPGVSDVLRNIAVATPAAAWSPVATWDNDSERPGSVLVFPKFIRGTFFDAINPVTPAGTGRITARTELEISVRCPDGATCGPKQPVTLRAHWVCPGCTESSFDLTTTVGGSLYFNPEGVTALGGVVTAEVYPNNATTTIPVPPCPRGYLIVWATDGSGNAIKFDGLIGDAVLRDGSTGQEYQSARSYNAISIQAGDGVVNTGDPTDLNGDSNLDFDGNEYQAISGRIFGTVRYENPGATITGNAFTVWGVVQTDLTLLTLDVASNRPNPLTSVGLNFYTTGEDLNDAGTSFYCWSEQRLTDINAGFTEQRMGRKGLVESYFAEQAGAPVTLLGIVETKEGQINAAGVFIQFRDYSYSLFHDNNPLMTTFQP